MAWLKMKKTLFISDLHLNEEQPDIARLFFQLLETCDDSIDGLYILGDLFEAWIGDDDNSPFHRKIMQKLKAATQKGLKIYFMRGNRDFLIGRQFAKKTGCRILSDEEVINLYGTRVLLMHGDTLCTKDITYLKWRNKARNPFLHTLFFLILPLFLRKKIANKMRAASAKYSLKKTMTIMDVTQAEVVRMMEKYKVHYLIHGHTHRPAFHQLTIQNQPAVRIVLNAWHGHGSVLVWDERGERELLDLENSA